MKRVLLVGKRGSGKTTLKQVLSSQEIGYKKTQAVEYSENIIDTPGEYLESRNFIPALIALSAECDVVALVQDCNDGENMFPPNLSQIFNKEAIGIITKIDDCHGDIGRVTEHLKLAGADKVFYTSAFKGEGMGELKEYLMYS